MITQFGMSDRLGLVALEGSRTPMFLPVPTSGPKEYSEETARIVDEEIKKILSEAHAKVRNLLARAQTSTGRTCEVAIGQRGGRAAPVAGDPE